MPRSSSPTTGWYGQLRNSLICNVGFLPIPVVMVRRDAIVCAFPPGIVAAAVTRFVVLRTGTHASST